MCQLDGRRGDSVVMNFVIMAIGAVLTRETCERRHLSPWSRI